MAVDSAHEGLHISRRTLLKAGATTAAIAAMGAAGTASAGAQTNEANPRIPESETLDGAVTLGNYEIYQGDDRESLSVPAIFISPDRLGIMGENLLYLRINTDYPGESGRKVAGISLTAEDISGFVESHMATDEQGNRSFPIPVTDDLALHYALQSKGIPHMLLPDDVNQKTRLNVTAVIGQQGFSSDNTRSLVIDKSRTGHKMSTISGFVDEMRRYHPGFEQVDRFLEERTEDGASLEKVLFNDGNASYALPCVKVDTRKMFEGITNPEIIVAVNRPKEDGGHENIGWVNLGYPSELENQRLLSSSGVMPVEPEGTALMYFPIVPTESWRVYVKRTLGVESLTPNLGDDGRPLEYKNGDLITVCVISRTNHVDGHGTVTKYHTGINTCSCQAGIWTDTLPQADPPVKSDNHEEQPPGVMQA